MKILFENNNIKWCHFDQSNIHEINRWADEAKINKLSLADSLEPGHLPKFEEFENWQFLILRTYHKENAFYHNIVRQFSNKISIFFKENTIITIEKQPIQFINDIKQEVNNKEDKNSISVKLILFQLVTYTLQSYQHSANSMAESIDKLENIVFLNHGKRFDLKSLYYIKREASSCKKVLTITLDTLREYGSINKKSSTYRDVIELSQKMLHLHGQVLEDAQSLLALSINISDQKANEVMKLLTIFSAFFLPLSFIVGLYGMNFSHMPELQLKYGYLLVWLLMITITVIIFIWFKRKKIL